MALAETCVAETGWTTRPPSRRLPAPVNAASDTDAVFETAMAALLMDGPGY